MNGSARRHRFALLLVASLAGGGRTALAADSASLQFTVPAPDPVQAGDTVRIQALAVNTGAQAWTAGSYYWVAEVYDLDQKLVGRTDQVSPPETVAAGGVASISLPFRVPDTMVGRRLYRVFLVKDAQQLIASEHRPFRILEKALPEPPKAVDYRVEGNVTVSYRNSSRNEWAQHNGATTLNAVGKIKESSYLFNAYLLHEPGAFVDPFIILLTYYAPWGTIFAGDISPTLSELSVNGQGMRGGMLEQKKGRWEWSVVGGQTLESQAGTATTNGRFARSLYAGKGAVNLLEETLKMGVNYFLSSDEPSSLSTDPNSPSFRGPTLVPQKNSGYGLFVQWQPRTRMKVLADYQANTYYADTSKAAVKDTAWRLEYRWEKQLFRLKTYVQRAGSDFVAFGAPSIVGDRMTFDGAVSVYPASWYTLSLSGNQYRDNLENDPSRVTTTQRFVSMGHNFQIRSATALGLSASLTTAKGQPASTLDNQTMTAGFNLTQNIGRQNISFGFQNSRFTDKNQLAHDLDTNTVSLSSNFYLPAGYSASLGVSNSTTKDKTDGSKRNTLSVSPSAAKRLNPKWTAQTWATLSKTKNDSATLPSDQQNLSFNSEFTYAQSAVSTLTLGAGYNRNKDAFNAAQTFNELTVSTRYSYSF